MKLLILGHARHGKDSVAEFISKEFGLTFKSSSLFAAERVVMPYLAELGVKWDSVEACYAARGDFRDEWHTAIAAYNAKDPAKLGREIFSEYDMYVGLRSLREFSAMHELGLFDAVIWVFRPELPLEPYSSMKLTPNLADLHIHNSAGLPELELQSRWAYWEAARRFGGLRSRSSSPWIGSRAGADLGLPGGGEPG